MFFFVFKFYLLQKRCSLNVLNMILETPNFKVTNIIFESYEHRSNIILQLLTSFVSYLHPNMADTENGKLEYPCFLFVFSLFSNIIISNV
jgi:hypothetical protein